MTSTAQQSSSLDSFGVGLGATIIRKGDADYDSARRVWNGMIDRSPAIIVRPKSTAEVVAAVKLARDNGLVLAVRGGGDNAAGLGDCDDAVEIH
jgi:FAD/FMN-containing dehydrogenase